MRELLRSNDLVRLSFLEAVLNDADVGVLVMDQFTSAVEGSIGALPRRLMVVDEDYDRAKEILSNIKVDDMENPFSPSSSDDK